MEKAPAKMFEHFPRWDKLLQKCLDVSQDGISPYRNVLKLPL